MKKILTVMTILSTIKSIQNTQKTCRLKKFECLKFRLTSRQSLFSFLLSMLRRSFIWMKNFLAFIVFTLPRLWKIFLKEFYNSINKNHLKKGIASNGGEKCLVVVFKTSSPSRLIILYWVSCGKVIIWWFWASNNNFAKLNLDC